MILKIVGVSATLVCEVKIMIAKPETLFWLTRNMFSAIRKILCFIKIMISGIQNIVCVIQNIFTMPSITVMIAQLMVAAVLTMVFKLLTVGEKRREAEVKENVELRMLNAAEEKLKNSTFGVRYSIFSFYYTYGRNKF
jgi:uncharacterized protein YlxW (UPF0749 family)